MFCRCAFYFIAKNYKEWINIKEVDSKLALKVSWNTILVNVFLSLFKLFAGFFSHSSAMISDAVHSLSDVFSTFVVIIGIKFASKKSDKDHPYGHERMECVAAIILAVILFVVGILIGWNGIDKIFLSKSNKIITPGILALIAAFISIIVKEAMYWYTRSAAKKLGSTALMADAWHHRSDAFSSVGSLIGILGARIGFPILDLVASLVICIFILKVALDIFKDAIGKMTDKACDDNIIEQFRSVILEQECVMSIDNINTRLFGNKIYVDVEISTRGDCLLYEAHDIAHKVHDAIESTFSQVKHCMVHVNPSDGRKNEIKQS